MTKNQREMNVELAVEFMNEIKAITASAAEKMCQTQKV